MVFYVLEQITHDRARTHKQPNTHTHISYGIRTNAPSKRTKRTSFSLRQTLLHSIVLCACSFEHCFMFMFMYDWCYNLNKIYARIKSHNKPKTPSQSQLACKYTHGSEIKWSDVNMPMGDWSEEKKNNAHTHSQQRHTVCKLIKQLT